MLKTKKYLYLINDLTNLLLKKNREEWHEKYEHLLKVFVVTLFLFAVSLIINIYQYVS